MQEALVCREEKTPNGINYKIFQSTTPSGRLPLILIMGYGGSLLSWPPDFVRKLAQNRDVLIFDNRGTGRSDKIAPGTDLRMHHFAEDLNSTMEHLKWQAADVLGYSMGGCIALEFARTYPDHVRKLVLQSTTAGGALYTSSDADIKERIMNPRGSTFDELFFDFFSLCFSADAFEHYRPALQIICEQSRPYPTSPMVLFAQLGAFRNFDLSADISAIPHSALVIHGEGDRIIKPKNGKDLAARLSRAKSVYFSAAGHCPHIEHFDATVAAIENFLSEAD